MNSWFSSKLNLYWSLPYFSKWQLPVLGCSGQKVEIHHWLVCFFHTPHLSPSNSSGYLLNITSSHCLCCYLSSSSHHHLSPRLLRWPPNYSTCFHPCPPTTHFQLSSQEGRLVTALFETLIWLHTASRAKPKALTMGYGQLPDLPTPPLSQPHPYLTPPNPMRLPH